MKLIPNDTLQVAGVQIDSYSCSSAKVCCVVVQREKCVSRQNKQNTECRHMVGSGGVSTMYIRAHMLLIINKADRLYSLSCDAFFLAASVGCLVLCTSQFTQEASVDN